MRQRKHRVSKTFLTVKALGLTEIEEKLIQNSATLVLAIWWFFLFWKSRFTILERKILEMKDLKA
jgi:hypothetical protein